MSKATAEELLKQHKTEREKIIQQEEEMALGGRLKLTDNEEKANKIIQQFKYHEVDYGFLHPEVFNFSHHYFSYKNKIKESKLYQIIEKMPKGAALHVHDTALLGPNYLLSITYQDNLYICYDGDRIHMVFSDGVPKEKCPMSWQLVKEARQSSGNVQKFDNDLKKHFTIVVDDAAKVDTDINAVWERLMHVFITITPMLCYKPVWEKYFYDALGTFRDDNIMYMEIRTTLPPLYELDGTVHDSLETARSYKKMNDKFIKDYPDFLGSKIIYAPLRLVEYSVVKDYLDTARALKRELGEFVAGFDLVGQEDLGRPLVDFLPLLTEAASELQYFFHAGETNWYGTSTDNNLVDAVLLGSRRLGHAYALLKHPVLAEMVRERNVGIEVNVISNQVLKLVDDVRNHPLAQFLAQGLPVVLSSDDPGLWEAAPLSHDYYVALVGVAARGAALRTLKQLALNSLHYSALSEAEKQDGLAKLEQRWTKFIDQLLIDNPDN